MDGCTLGVQCGDFRPGRLGRPITASPTPLKDSQRLGERVSLAPAKREVVFRVRVLRDVHAKLCDSHPSRGRACATPASSSFCCCCFASESAPKLSAGVLVGVPKVSIGVSAGVHKMLAGVSASVGRCPGWCPTGVGRRPGRCPERVGQCSG